MSGLKLLAIETSSAIGSIAVGVDGEVLEKVIATPREQTPRILAIVDELLAEAGLKLPDLDALVFGRGPGSFTGLRVAAAVVQGLSFSAGPPIVSVSSLAALAERAFAARRAPAADAGLDTGTGGGAASDHALCCIDARMNEVYWASFSRVDGRTRAIGEERISKPDALGIPEHPFIALGDGFTAYPEALAGVSAAASFLESSAVPSASALLTLAAPDVDAGDFVPIEAALPVYLRESDAWKKSG